MNYTAYSNEDILSAYYAVDREKYPDNFRLILAEMVKRNLLTGDEAWADANDLGDVQSDASGTEITRPKDTPPQEPPATYADTVLNALRKEGGRGFNPFYLVVISGLLFLVAGTFAFSWHYLLLILPVIFIHELGHLFAMRFFGYKNTRILFIPLLGGLATGAPSEYDQKKNALVSLAGPLFGLAVGACFLFTYKYTHSTLLLQFGTLSCFINALNLVPLPPLDGGRILQALITERHAMLEVAYGILAIALLSYAAVAWDEWWLLFLVSSLLFSVRFAYKDRKVLGALAANGGLEGSSLDSGNVERILSTIQSTEKRDETLLRPSLAAARVRHLFNKALQKRASWPATLMILLSYVLIFALAIILFAVAYTGERNLGLH